MWWAKTSLLRSLRLRYAKLAWCWLVSGIHCIFVMLFYSSFSFLLIYILPQIFYLMIIWLIISGILFSGILTSSVFFLVFLVFCQNLTYILYPCSHSFQCFPGECLKCLEINRNFGTIWVNVFWWRFLTIVPYSSAEKVM